MIKKILALFISICVFASVLTVFANEDTKITASSNTNVAGNYISKLTNLKKPEEFSGVVDCNAKAKIQNIYAYTEFIYQNNFTFEEMEIINRILGNDTTVQSLAQVYDFWLTTDEDFDMIEKICALEDEYFSEHWFESAFNTLTNSEHGELDGNEVIDYLSKGITTDEILAANVMSRKKGQNIHTILDSHLAGYTIESQIETVYGAKFTSEETLFAFVTTLSKNSRKPSQLRTSTELNVLRDFINTRAQQEISRLKISAETPENAFADFEALKKSGYPVSVQKVLLNKGYTPQEIEISAKLNEFNLNKAAKKAREMIKNEK